MATLRLIAIDKSFSGKKILENIMLDTNDGELVVILGPSGCGKSTLLRIIAGLEEANAGEVWIGPRRVDKLPPRRRNVALVFQNYALYPHMTVKDNLAFPLKIARLRRREIRDKVISTASLLGLEDRLDSRPSELSGGQRQRVALGRAIIRRPELFLLDEPLSNLDADLRTRMRREIVQLQKHLGTTTIHVTHDQTEALTMADRLVVIESGKIRQTGTVSDIYNHPADVFVAGFIGTPKINLIDGWIADNRIRPFNLSRIMIPANYDSREIIVGIRPEDLEAGEGGEYSGTVKSVEYLGDRTIVTVQFLSDILTLIAPPDRYDPGETIKFSVNPDKLHLFDKKAGSRLRE